MYMYTFSVNTLHVDKISNENNDFNKLETSILPIKKKGLVKYGNLKGINF